MSAMPEEYTFMEGLVTQLALLMCHLVDDRRFFDFFACLSAKIVVGHVMCSFDSIECEKKLLFISDIMQGFPVFAAAAKEEESLPPQCVSLLKRHFVYCFRSEPRRVASYDIADFMGEGNRGRRERFVSQMHRVDL